MGEHWQAAALLSADGEYLRAKGEHGAASVKVEVQVSRFMVQAPCRKASGFELKGGARLLEIGTILHYILDEIC